MKAQLEKECRLLVRQNLEHLTGLLVSKLRLIITAKYPASTYLLWFEYDSAHWDDSFSVMFSRINRAGEEEERREFLPEVSSTIPEEVLYAPKYENAELNTWNLASEIFETWFAECWEAAGGHDSRWLGYLAHHDSAFSFDLTHRRTLKFES
jgi:hypothetical protein